MYTIFFYLDFLDVRGTCVSTYDYASYNETLLHNRSIILTSGIEGETEIERINLERKFRNRFPVYFSDKEKLNDKIEEIIKNKKLNRDKVFFYKISYGKRNETPKLNIKTLVHCVFDLSEPHGDVYAGVSKTLADKFGWKLYVPHMISLLPDTCNDNMRKELGIPEDAIVFGRHGGKDTFDLSFVFDTIIDIVNNYDNIYFVFMNLPVFYLHRQIKHISPVIDIHEKKRFIRTCDAMIHAQSLGETFGIAIGEFNVHHKPVITYGGAVWNDNYKKILGNNAHYYLDCNELKNILIKFERAPLAQRSEGIKSKNLYLDFTPKKVMKQFENIFLNQN